MKKKIIMLFTALSLFVAPQAVPQAHAQEGIELVTLVGFYFTFVNWAAGKIIGQSTVTPTVGLNSWDAEHEIYEQQNNLGVNELILKARGKARYAPRNGGYTYWSSTQSKINTNVVESSAWFNIPGIGLENYHCGTKGGYYGWEYSTHTYTVYVDCIAASTGAFPPQPPYPVTLKTTGTKLAETCGDTDSGWTRQFEKELQLTPGKPQVVTVGHPSFDMSWPFVAWSGHSYKY